MEIVIKDKGACISIERHGVPLIIVKANIKAIDTVGADAVRLNIGEGPLRNIYINPLEVIEPKTKDVFDLFNYFTGLLEKGVA